MNFFRLRLLNTVLVLLAGIILGAVLRDRLRRSAQEPPPAPRYQPEYESRAGQRGGEALREDEEDKEAGEDPEAEYGDEAPPGPRPVPERKPSPARQAAVEAEIGDASAAVLLPTPAQFFKKPEAFAGSRLELRLQIITAQKRGEGWRLNFVHTGADGAISYLYVDDAGALGPSPDLKVGHYYAVRFDCSGDPAEGNRLVSAVPTGEKASWATGLSAVE